MPPSVPNSAKLQSKVSENLDYADENSRAALLGLPQRTTIVLMMSAFSSASNLRFAIL